MENSKCKKVMVIDDNEIDIFIGTKMIKLCNFAEKIIEKKSGIDALDFLSSNSKNTEELPDYIFLDLFMPMHSGFDFLEAFSQMPQKVKSKCKIVVLSVVIDEDELQQLSRNSDVFTILQKPLNADLLKVLQN